MSEATIRTAIAGILDDVTGIGQVYQYRRWANTWEKLLELFKDANDRINGWMVSRVRTPSKRLNLPTVERTHTFSIVGVYGLQDSAQSEIAFQAIIEAIEDAFDSEYLLTGTVLNSGPVQVKLVENRMFGGALCHYCELEIEAVERVTYSA